MGPGRLTLVARFFFFFACGLDADIFLAGVCLRVEAFRAPVRAFGFAALRAVRRRADEAPLRCDLEA
jgi:hypothetical protein